MNISAVGYPIPWYVEARLKNYQGEWLAGFRPPEMPTEKSVETIEYVDPLKANSVGEKGHPEPPYDREQVKGSMERIANGTPQAQIMPPYTEDYRLSSMTYMGQLWADYADGNLTGEEFYAHLEELSLVELEGDGTPVEAATPEQHAEALEKAWKMTSFFLLKEADRQMYYASKEQSTGSCYFDSGVEEKLQAELNDWAAGQCEKYGLDSSFIKDKPIQRLQVSGNHVTVRSESLPPKNTAYWINPRDGEAGIRIDGEWLTVENTFDPANYRQRLSDIFAAHEDRIRSSNPGLWEYLLGTTASVDQLARLNEDWVRLYGGSNLAAEQYDQAAFLQPKETLVSYKA